jgi:hypothetical protein
VVGCGHYFAPVTHLVQGLSSMLQQQSKCMKLRKRSIIPIFTASRGHATVNLNNNQGAVEVCNSIDDNCNGQTDGGVKNTYYADADGDSFGNAAVTALPCMSVKNSYISSSQALL